jgi:hypothetical protein
VQIAVRLGREAGVHLHTGVSAALGQVLVNKIMDKIACGRFLVHKLKSFCMKNAFSRRRTFHATPITKL